MVENDLLDALIEANLSGGQLRIMLYFIRQIDGYQGRQSHQISAATLASSVGLAPKSVARALRDLVARRYLVALTPQGGTPTYRLQRDASQWIDELEDDADLDHFGSTPPYKNDPPTPPKNDPTPGSKMIHPSIYKEKNKETGKETRTISLRERWQDAYECAVDGSAQLHVLAEMFRELFGREPNLPRIGVLRKQARSGFALMAIMLEAAKERIGDDPHDYLQKMLQRRNERPPERDRFVPQAEINSGRHKRLVL